MLLKLAALLMTGFFAHRESAHLLQAPQPPRARRACRPDADRRAKLCCGWQGNKYGAEPGDAAALLGTARALGLDVAGICFHVGSGATNPQARPCLHA